MHVKKMGLADVWRRIGEARPEARSLKDARERDDSLS